MYVVTFFFFFQAEDGIRDYKVTGVQTCALRSREIEALCRTSLDVRKENFPNDRQHETYLAKSGRLQCVWLKRGRREALMITFLFVAVLANSGFLCLTGPDGVIRPKHRQ